MKTDVQTIVLAEDNPNDVELTLAAFAENGLLNDIVVLRDGAETLDYLYARGAWATREPGDPAVVLLDIKMPRMNGLDVLTQMRNDEQFRRIPVVILSSSREESDLARSWDLGANAYVIKPVDVDQFFDAVRTLGQFWAVLNQAPEQE